MSADNLHFSIDALPVSIAPKPSRPETPASRNDSTGGQFRELLSDSMGDSRETRRTDRRDDAPSPSRRETTSPRETASRETPNMERSADQSQRRSEVSPEPKLAPERAETPDVSTVRDDEQIAAEPIEHSDTVSYANESTTTTTHVAEGTPPAEFVAALLATQTTTTNAAAASTENSFETTTITVQTPPQGLVTALAAANNESANSVLTKNQLAGGAAGLDAATGQPAAVNQLVNDAAASGTAVENSTQPTTTPAIAEVAAKPSANETAAVSTDGRESGAKQAAASQLSQVPPSETVENAGKKNSAVPAAPHLPSQSPAATTSAAEQQSAAANVNGISIADAEATAPPITPPTKAASEGTGTSASNGLTTSDEAGPQRPIETNLDGQQPQSGSSDNSSQRNPADSASFTDALASAGDSARPQITAVAADDSATGRETTTDSTLGGPSPISQQPATSRAASTTVSATTEPAVDVERPDFAMRVANAVRTSAESRQHVTMRLTPPELGALRIEVAVEHGSVSARIEAQSAAAQKILLDSLPQLKEALSQNGASVERLEVMLSDNSPKDHGGAMGQGFAGQGERGNESRQQSSYGDRGLNSLDVEQERETDTPMPKSASRRRAITELDVKI